MKKHAFVLISICFLCHSHLSGQVNLQTGAAHINVPLYDYKDAANRIGLNINLSYVNGNGIKVSEVASAVGTGWQLNCGGVITRTQNGAPDDQKQNKTYINPYSNDNAWFDYAENYFPNGYLYSEYQPTTPVTGKGAYSPYSEHLPLRTYFGGGISRPYKPAPEYLADREQDIFSFYFNGVSGQFLIGKNKTVRSLTDSKLKFDFVEADISNTNIRTTISQFRIIDETGIEYIFRDRELSNVCLYDDFHLYNKNNGYFYRTSKTSGDGYTNVLNGRPLNQFVVNRWFLSEIKNPLTNKKISFNYDTYEVDYKANKIGTLSNVNNIESMVVHWQRNKAISKRLISVNLSSAEKLEFKYYNEIRNDISSEVFLEKIIVKYNEQEVYDWIFNFKYFTYSNGLSVLKGLDETFSAREKQYARLYLTSIEKKGKSSAGDQPYKFDYNPIAVPLFSIFQDHYGYVNLSATFEPNPGDFYTYSTFADIIKDDGIFSKEPYLDLAKQGIISTVTYPTGGSLSYEYEPNFCLYNLQNTQVGGVRVKSTTQFDGRSLTNKVDYQYKQANGKSSGWGYEPMQYSKTSFIKAYRTDKGKSPAGNLNEIAWSFGVSYMNAVAGVTSSSIINSAFTSSIVNAVIGIAISIVVFILYDIIAPDFSEFTVNEWSNASTTNSNPLPIQYSRIEVINKDANNQEAGRTVYHFTDLSLRPLEVEILSEPYSQKQRFANWVYGLPKSIDVYKKGETNPVKKTIYDYNLYVTTLNDPNFLSRKWEAKKRSYDRYLTGFNTNLNDIIQETYSPITGRAELKQIVEYLYSSNTFIPSTSSTTDFIYSPSNFKIKQTVTRNSKNEIIETNTYYPSDYSTIPILQTLMKKNMVSTPVSTQTFINKNANKYLINGSVNEYSLLPNGDVGVIKKYSFESNLPVDQSQVAFNDSQLIPNTNLYKQSISILYNNQNGLPSQIATSGGNKTAFIYDYDNKAVVAKVSDAEINDIAYSSFEEGSGNWLITSAARTNSTAVTGSKSYDIGKGNIIKPGLDAGKVYNCTFWATSNSNVTVSGSQATRQSSSYNGWTLWSYTVTGVTSVTLNGTGVIDELRLYPEGAQMNTKTYRPLIGVTSECDTDNKIMYYLYDESGRLMFVRDQDRNILKRYCYKMRRSRKNVRYMGIV